MMIWAVLLIIVVFSTICIGANEIYYVNDSTVTGGWGAGNDGNAGTSKDSPKATIENVLDNQTVGVGEDCNIVVRDGATLPADRMAFDTDTIHNSRNFIIGSENGTSWTFTSDSAYLTCACLDVNSGSLSISDMIISSSSIIYMVWFDAEDGMNLTLKDCNLITTGAGSLILINPCSSLNPARNINIENTYLQCVSAGISLNDTNDVNIVNSTVKCTHAGGTGILVNANTHVDSLSISDSSNIEGGSNNATFAVRVPGTSSMEYVRIFDSNISGGDIAVSVEDDVCEVVIYNCTIKGGAIDAYSAGVVIGEDSVTEVDEGIGRISILNSTISSATGSSIYLYYGSGNGDIGYNHLSAGPTAHGFALIGNNHHVYHNISTGNLALYEAFGGRNHIHNNTIISSGTAFLTGLPGQGVGALADCLWPTGSNVHDNIFVTTSGSHYAMYDYEPDASGTNPRGTNGNDYITHYINYNCYWNTADPTKIVHIGYDEGNTYDTIEEVKIAWQTGGAGGIAWNTMYAEQCDQNSIIADPQFVDSANGDYSLKLNSPCIGSASNKGDMGANQFLVRPNQSSVDLDYDGIVNFSDLAIFAGQWLETVP